MKFFGSGIVWDAANDRPLCQFADGQLETEDPAVIEILLEIGFDHEEIPQVKRKKSPKA